MQRPQPKAVTLDDILITEDLLRRSPRAPNWQAENQALHTLARQMAQDSQTLMQTLVSSALELCQAGTAGVSLLEKTPNGEEVFRWNVLAGALEQYVGATTPRSFSPCGVCLDRSSPVLFSHPERVFTYFQATNTPVVEGLVLPLIADNRVLGTIWIMSHDEQRYFDSEDVRLMTSLADFTAVALLLHQRQTKELLAANAALETENAERKQAEERLRALIENLPGGAAFIVDRNLRYLLAAGEALAIAGFKRKDLVGRTIFEVLPPELTTNYEMLYRKALAGEVFEYEHNAHDRSYISRGTPLRSANGEVYAVLAVSYDISDRIEAEASLRESEVKYRSLFTSIDEGYALCEVMYDQNERPVDLRYLEVNPAFEQLSGLQNVVGKTAAELNPIVESFWVETSAQVVQTGVATRFEEYAEGLDRWFDVYLSRVGGEGSCQIAVVLNNITDRKRTEEQLRRAAELDAFRVALSDALRSLSDPVQIQAEASRLLGEQLGVDRAYYVEVNEVESYARVNQDYLRGDSPTLAGTFRLVDYGWIVPHLRRGETIIVTDADNTDMIPEAERAAMGVVKIASHITIPLVKAGALVGALCVTELEPRQWSETEIELVRETAERIWAAIERAYAERALRDLEIQRIQEQSAREEERQRAEALAELDRAKTLFFSNVSHEFRTPLTLLIAPLQDALSDRTHPLVPPQRERLELAHRNANRLLKLVNTLLDFSRIEAGRMEAVYEPTDLAQFTAELASVFRSCIERAGLRLMVDCPPLPEPVYVDRQMWEKIVLNLISNAFKFTTEGEITVSLHPIDGNQVILQIQDTGAGIAPEHLPHLFERFYQVRGIQARTHEGSGIGLALVHELVRLHGGTIKVTSIVGQGTCFMIALPLGTDHLQGDRLRLDLGDHIEATRMSSAVLGAAPYVAEVERWLPEQGGDQGESSSLSLASPAHVLLVDDNADMRDYLTRILSQYVQVEAVADGTAALAAAGERVPDLVLTDVMMPGLDGFGLLQALRADSRTREVPIILLSARAGAEAVIEGLQAGADDYLIKPFSALELVSRVNGHLQMAQLRSVALQQERTTSERKDELLSIVSHELNTPLVSILGWTRLLRSVPPSPAMLMKSLETIERNAELQAKLVQDLLDISRITAGKLRLDLEPVKLELVVASAIATVSQTAQAKGINLIWQPTTAPGGTDSIAVMGDRDRLGQVICNVLTNAIKFTPESGSVTIDMSVVNERDSYTSYAQIRVADTGIGIAADFLPHVFERFRQAESASAKGLGLGLAIAHHLVELHNGTIHAESPGVGQGATFVVKLPLIEP